MSFLRRLYQKVIISVDIDVYTCKVRIAYHNNNNLSQEEKTYKTINGDFPIEAAKYIRRIKNKYPFTYIATMSRSKNQGLIAGNKINSFEKFNISAQSLAIILISKKWFVYINKEDIIKDKNKFSKVQGVDFIFSPFVLIYEKIKDRVNEIKKLYILQEKGSCTLLVADSNGVYFGDYKILEQNKFVEENSMQEIEEIDSTSTNIEFEAISDMDENIIIKDFDDKDTIQDKSALNDLSVANTMINIIKDTLNNFYKDDRYASDFIEELLILDGCGISDSSITHLTNNIMLETQFLRIDTCEEIEKLAKMELKL
ncbi:MAG: hypothetical protein K2P17_02270 [Helicobacteraceae bacterium]|nr:hypothetical protein [Helicobacteraceae bacterium]